MTNCPKCGAPVDSGAGFGMLTCPQCSEIFLIGEQPSSQANVENFTESVSEPSASESQEVFFEPLTPQESQSQGEVELIMPSQPTTPDFQDVAEFGNQQLPSTATGALVYDISIAGIDTSEIRESLMDSLRDKKLGLNLNEVFQSINKGELLLEQINPVKASVILARIKYLPLQIKWAAKQLIKSMIIVSIVESTLASDWGRHEINLRGYAMRIANTQNEIKELVEKKNKNRDPHTRDELLKEINKKNDDLRRVYKDFKEEKEHVRFEHPEQGDKTERKYKRVRMKSLEDLENEVGLDGQLTRLKQKVEKKYPVK